MPQPLSPTSSSALSLPDQVSRVIELIRPAIHADGGDVELVEVTPAGIVQVRFHGACVGCPSSVETLQKVIEKSVMIIDGVNGVEAV